MFLSPRHRTSRILRVLATLMLAVLALASCASDDGESVDSAQRTVVTDQGKVQVPQSPERVVVLNFALAGYLYDLDVPVVGVTQEDFDYEAKFSDFWAEDAQREGTEFVSWGMDGFNLEQILALQPDLIVGGGLGMPLMFAQKAYEDLSSIAPTIIVSGDKVTWQEQYSFLADEVFGKAEVYDAARTAYEDRVKNVADSITPPPGPSAFLSILPDGRVFVAREDMGLPVVFASVGIEPAPLFATGDYEPYTDGGDSFELSSELLSSVITQPSVFITGFNTDIGDIETQRKRPEMGVLPAFESDQAYMLPYWVARGDYDESMALLNIIEDLFG